MSSGTLNPTHSLSAGRLRCFAPKVQIKVKVRKVGMLERAVVTRLAQLCKNRKYGWCWCQQRPDRYHFLHTSNINWNRNTKNIEIAIEDATLRREKYVQLYLLIKLVCRLVSWPCTWLFGQSVSGSMDRLFIYLIDWLIDIGGLTFLNAGKSVGGHVKKSTTSPFFNRITFHLAVRCKTFQQINP